MSLLLGRLANASLRTDNIYILVPDNFSIPADSHNSFSSRSSLKLDFQYQPVNGNNYWSMQQFAKEIIAGLH